MKIKSLHGYEIGQTVYVKPSDADVLKGVVVGFQEVGDHLPVVECDHPYKKGEKFSIAYSLDRISKTTTVTTFEWRLVPVEHEYKRQRK